MNLNRRTEIILLVLSSVFFGLLYLWLVSVGTWVHLSQTSTYFYRMQADGFLAGTPALLEKPDPRLAKLANPYLREARQDIPFLLDASYYKGKYYFYYGPIPAVILAGFMLIFKHGLSDGYFTLIGGLITFFFSATIILKIRRYHFRKIPLWLLVISLAIIGFSPTILWVMNAARIYEAAISMGIAFLVAGLFFALDTLEGERSRVGYLLLASFLWGLAIGTRLFLGGAAAILCAATLYRVLSIQGKMAINKKSVITALVFLTPVLISLMLLGWYNYIRFDNPFEPGWRYAFTGTSVPYLSSTLQVFNIRYLPFNLYNYLLNPYIVTGKFPFLLTGRANASLYTSFFHTSSGYNPEFITGLFLTSPFILFIGYFAWYALKNRSKIPDHQEANPRADAISRSNSLIITLATIGIAQMVSFIAILLYPVISNRFFLDFLPLLNVVAIVSIWLAYNRVQVGTCQRRIVSSLVIVMGVYSFLASFLLALIGELNRFHI